MDWIEACRILGVSGSATDSEIKEQYIYKAQLLHPDKNQDKSENVRKKAEAELGLINQAYSFLSNPNNNPYKIPPKLAVEPAGIRFRDVKGGEKKSTVLLIKNTGGPYTSIWIDNNPAPWLSITSVKSISAERLPLEVTLECTGSGEPGKAYFCDLLVKLENENTQVVDRVTVKVEMYIESAPLKNAVPVETPTTNVKPIPVVQPEPQSISSTPKAAGGFSFGAFFINLLAFAITGLAVFFSVNFFFSLNTLVLILSLIIYSIIALGFSLYKGFKAGSKAGKP
jgi:hypothetical protein